MPRKIREGVWSSQQGGSDQQTGAPLPRGSGIRAKPCPARWAQHIPSIAHQHLLLWKPGDWNHVDTHWTTQNGSRRETTEMRTWNFHEEV
ncbi:hypothetical protein ABVT39_021088 [Epinephelus coioides]